MPRHKILLVDDEPDILESLELSLEADYDVLTATNGDDGLTALRENDIAVIITDQRMPRMTGVEFLQKAQEFNRHSVRMMLTGFADIDAIVDAINKGQVYRYISKPWEPRDLEMDVRRAAETYDLRVSYDRRMIELQTLCEIGAAVTALLDSDEVIQKILGAVVQTLGFDRSFLLLVDEEANVLRNTASVGLKGEALKYFESMEYSLDRDDVAVVITVKDARPILVEDVDDPPITLDREAIRQIGFRSFVTAPLRAAGRPIGVLVADRSGAGERVTQHDQRLLSGFADQAAIAIENARLYGEALQKQEMEEELGVAARIQRHLLPSEIPVVDGFEITGCSDPSRWVSGDYYDVVHDGSGRLWVALGDVSGKGVQAGLTMATLRTLFRGEIEREQSLPEAMSRISDGLYRSTLPEVFATFCFGVLDPASRTFTYVNAGHPNPIVARDGSALPADGPPGPPVGFDPSLFNGVSYEERSVTFEPGDLLLIYSDGVTEAGVSGDDMFGEERLTEVFSDSREAGPLAAQDAVRDAVTSFVGDAPQDDDVTLVVIGAK